MDCFVIVALMTARGAIVVGRMGDSCTRGESPDARLPLVHRCVNPPRTVRDPAIDIMAGATFERHLLSLRPGPPISGRRGGKVNCKVFIRV